MALSPARFVDPLTEGRQCWVQRDNGPAELHQVVNGTLMPVGDHTPTPKPRRWLDADAAPRPNYRPHRRQITRPVTPPVPKPAPQESKTMSTVNTAPAPANVNADTRMGGVVDWTKRAFAAGAEGAKDGAALAIAETLTAGVIAAVAVEAPIVLTIYNGSALAQKILQVVVPYTVGLVATLGWLPQADTVASLCERALRAAVVTNVAPILGRFKLPIMRVVENAMDMDRAAARMAGRDGERRV